MNANLPPVTFQQPDDQPDPSGPVDQFAAPTWQAPPSSLEVAGRGARRTVRFGFQKVRHFLGGLVNWLRGSPDNTIARAGYESENQAGWLGIGASALGLLIFGTLVVVVLMPGGEWLPMAAPLATFSWAIPVGMVQLGKRLGTSKKAPAQRPPAAAKSQEVTDSFTADGDRQNRGGTRRQARSVKAPLTPLAIVGKRIDRFMVAHLARVENRWLALLLKVLAVLAGVLTILAIVIGWAFGVPLLVFWFLSLVTDLGVAAIAGLYTFVWTLTVTPVWQNSVRLWRLGKLERARKR